MADANAKEAPKVKTEADIVGVKVLRYGAVEGAWVGASVGVPRSHARGLFREGAIAYLNLDDEEELEVIGEEAARAERFEENLASADILIDKAKRK